MRDRQTECTVYALIFAGLNFRGFRRSAAIRESFTLWKFSLAGYLWHHKLQNWRRSNDNLDESTQWRTDTAANSCTDDDSSLMPRWAESELAKRTLVSPRVQLLGRFFASVCRSTTWGCPFVCFWSRNGEMSQIWEGFSTSVAEDWRKERTRKSWKSVICENKNAKIAKTRDLQKFNPMKSKAYTVCPKSKGDLTLFWPIRPIFDRVS